MLGTLIYERDNLGFVRMLCLDQPTGRTPQGKSPLSPLLRTRLLRAGLRRSDTCSRNQGTDSQSRAEKTPPGDVVRLS